MNNLVCFGVISNVHGLKGEVKIKPFTSSASSFIEFHSFTDEEENILEFKYRSIGDSQIIASIKGVTSRTDAEKFKGRKLYILREELPEIKEENTFYIEDLIDSKIILEGSNKEFGIVTQVFNFGAGDIVEIKKIDNTKVLYNLTSKIFPVIDVNKKIIEIIPPEEV
ncbi:MAG: 16S rRNA processing protein RimM [Sphingobacteriia bacterium]|nr:16S rRNA processing protein RimM [Sphingobacteriia bacterium]